MGKKININNQLDIHLLNEQIIKYRSANNGEKPYLFINKETAKALDLIFIDNNSKHNTSYIVDTYGGCRTYYDPDLSYGEVELR